MLPSQRAAPDDATTTKILTKVFYRLRGLLTCDDVPIPDEYVLKTPDEQSAMSFLNEVCSVCVYE